MELNLNEMMRLPKKQAVNTLIQRKDKVRGTVRK